MPLGERAYRALALGMGARFRSRRWRLLMAHFPELADYRVIDLGGELDTWEVATVRPRHLTLLNPAIQTQKIPGGRSVRGDACAPPMEILSEKYDLVVSNSALEHVGGYWRRREFAESVHRLAPRHWVQTPARSFPIEPHWLFPGFQWLPVAARVAVSRAWPIGFPRSREEPQLTRDVLEVELVSAHEMQHLFPTSRLARERFLGLTKSLVSLRA